MAMARVDSTGRITIPARFREQLAIANGSSLRIEVVGDEIRTRPIRSVRDLSGIIAEAAEGKSTDWDTIREQMGRAVAKERMRKMREQARDHAED